MNVNPPQAESEFKVGIMYSNCEFPIVYYMIGRVVVELMVEEGQLVVESIMYI